MIKCRRCDTFGKIDCPRKCRAWNDLNDRIYGNVDYGYCASGSGTAAPSVGHSEKEEEDNPLVALLEPDTPETKKPVAIGGTPKVEVSLALPSIKPTPKKDSISISVGALATGIGIGILISFCSLFFFLPRNTAPTVEFKQNPPVPQVQVQTFNFRPKFTEPGIERMNRDKRLKIAWNKEEIEESLLESAMKQREKDPTTPTAREIREIEESLLKSARGQK